MATTESPIQAAAAPHPAWYARAGTMFLKIGHAIKAIAMKIAGEMPAIQAEIVKIAPTLEAVSNMLLPGSGNFEAHLLDVWGVAANAVKDAGAVAGANGISITLDAALIADIKGFLPEVEKYLHTAASPAPPDATPGAQPSPKPQPIPGVTT
jgi:hypothetical protein